MVHAPGRFVWGLCFTEWDKQTWEFVIQNDRQKHWSGENPQNYTWKWGEFYEFVFFPIIFIRTVHAYAAWKENTEGARVYCLDSRPELDIDLQPAWKKPVAIWVAFTQEPWCTHFLNVVLSLGIVLSVGRGQSWKRKNWWADCWLGMNNLYSMRKIKSSEVIYASWGSELASLVLATSQPKGWEQGPVVCK